MNGTPAQCCWSFGWVTPQADRYPGTWDFQDNSRQSWGSNDLASSSPSSVIYIQCSSLPSWASMFSSLNGCSHRCFIGWQWRWNQTKLTHLSYSTSSISGHCYHYHYQYHHFFVICEGLWISTRYLFFYSCLQNPDLRERLNKAAEVLNRSCHLT